MYNNLLILIAVIAIINSAPTHGQKEIDYKTDCINSSGKWLEQYNECEFARKEWCDEKGGVFHECASDCRHNKESDMCITLCVPVCKIK